MAATLTGAGRRWGARMSRDGEWRRRRTRVVIVSMAELGIYAFTGGTARRRKGDGVTASAAPLDSVDQCNILGRRGEWVLILVSIVGKGMNEYVSYLCV
jgi:hypothetical protein